MRSKSKTGYLLLPVLLLAGLSHAAGTMVVDSFTHPDPRIGKRYVQIYLPEGYNPGGTIEYPVIYFLHGAKDGVGSGYANHLSYPYMKGILDAMIGNGVIEPIIMAKPNAVCSPYVISWHTNSALNGPWESYTYSSIVSFMESNYKTISDPDFRYLMGHSAGGYGMFRTAFRHPGVFSAVASHSGSGLDPALMIQVSLPSLLKEYPEGPPYYWSPTRGFLSATLFSLSAAWTPNLSNPPYYVDLPLDSMANVIDSLYDVWIEQAVKVFAESLPSGQRPRTFFDCGMLDELGGYPPNRVLDVFMDSIGFDHEWQPYLGGHFESLPTRVPIGIAFLVGIKAIPEFAPRVLDLESEDRYITCHIELPAPFSAADIVPGTVVIDQIDGEELEDPLSATGPYAVGKKGRGRRPSLMVKFDRQALIDELVEMDIEEGDEVELRVAGELESQIPFRDVGMLGIVGGGEGEQADRVLTGFSLDLKPAGTGQGVVHYSLPSAAHVRMLVYDATGRLVATPVDGAKAAGLHRANLGSVAAGVYIVRLEAGESSVTAKLVRTD